MATTQRNGLAEEMARFAAMTEAWADMAEAAHCDDAHQYQAAKVRFWSAAEDR